MPKDASYDRQIVNAREPDGEEGPLIADDRFLPSGSMWCELGLADEERLVTSSSYLADCYHQPDVTRAGAS